MLGIFKYVKQRASIEQLDKHITDVFDTFTFILFCYIGHSGCAIFVLSHAIPRRHSRNKLIYPTSILQGKYPIIGIRDLTTGYDNTKPENKAVLPVSKSSEMITFTFKNGLVTTLRTSGTEPKIKYYSELCASPEEQDIGVLKKTLDEMISALVTEFLQPELNGLIARPT